MTVSTTVSRKISVTNGATTSFPFSFQILETGDFYAVHVATDLTETALVNGVDYTLNTGPWQSGGTLTTIGALSPLATGNIVMYRQMDYKQLADLLNNKGYDANNLETIFDRMVLYSQQLDDENSRALTMSINSSLTNAVVEDPVADAVLKWNATADEVENGPTTTDLVNAEANANAAQASASAASASASAAAADADTVASARQFQAHGADTPDMRVVIEPGRVFTGVTHIVKAEQITTVIAAPTTNPRIDRVAIDKTTGDYVIITGTEAASPVAPAYGVNHFPDCQFQLETGTTTISDVAQSATNAEIIDERALIQVTNKIRNWGYTIASFAAPDLGITGVAIDPATGNLISCDSGTDLIYIHDGISAKFTSFAAPALTPRGVAIDPATGNLISCDSGTDLIYIHDGISATISSSFAAPDLLSSGVAIDPATGNLISCDLGTDLIYIHDGISATISSSFAASLNIRDVAIDPATGNLISCDSGTDLIYIHLTQHVSDYN